MQVGGVALSAELQPRERGTGMGGEKRAVAGVGRGCRNNKFSDINE